MCVKWDADRATGERQVTFASWGHLSGWEAEKGVDWRRWTQALGKADCNRGHYTGLMVTARSGCGQGGMKRAPGFVLRTWEKAGAPERKQVKRPGQGVTSLRGAMWSLKGRWDVQLEDAIRFTELGLEAGLSWTHSSD